MGDMSKCSHGEYVGYCDTCSPDWELQLITAEAQDKIYQRGFEKGAADFKRRAVEVCAALNAGYSIPFEAVTQCAEMIESLPLIGEKHE